VARKRVLHLADSPYGGGIASHIITVAEAFRDDPEWEIRLATLSGTEGDETLMERAASIGIKVDIMKMRMTFDLSVRKRLRHYVEANEISLVHTHGYRANVIAGVSNLPVPVVTTSHGLAVQPILRLRLWQAMHLRMMRHQAGILACSSFVSDELQRCGIAREAIRVVNNAIGEPGNAHEPFTRDEYDVASEKIVLLYAGRFDPGKRLDCLLSAMAQVPQYHLLLFGAGLLEETIESQGRDLDIDVSMAGWTPFPEQFYPMADVVVLPTEMEALPMTLIEAASHGKPVIATNVGGVPEVVVQGETGVLVDDNSVDSWVDALGKLTDASLRSRLGEAARVRHREHFSLETLLTSLSAVYSDLLSSAK